MKLTANMFADELAACLVETRNIDVPGLAYDSVRLALPGARTLEKHHAYVISEDDLCKMTDIDPSCLLIIAGNIRTDLDGPALACSDSLPDVYESAIRALERYNRLEGELNAGLLENKDLDALLCVCAEFFGNVLQLLDPAINVVAGVGPVFENGKLVRFDRFESDFTASVVSEMSRQNLLQVTYAFKSARYFKSELFSHGAVHYNLFDGNVYLGKLLLIEQQNTITPGAIDAVDRVGRYFRHWMIQRKATLNVSLFTTEYFLSEIIAGRIRDAEFIQSQLGSIGWDARDTYRIACVSVMAQEAIDFYVQTLRKALIQAVVFPQENFVLAVLHIGQLSNLAHEQQLVRFLSEAKLQAGLSEVFHDFREAKTHGLQAKFALKLGCLADPSRMFYPYEHYVLDHVVLALADSQVDRAILHPAYAKIRDYDSKNGTDFLQTLQVYLACAGNQTLTAEQLHIHRNSLKYRLARLREFIGDDLDDPSQRLRLQLSQLIVKQIQSNPSRLASQTTQP